MVISIALVSFLMLLMLSSLPHSYYYVQRASIVNRLQIEVYQLVTRLRTKIQSTVIQT